MAFSYGGLQDTIKKISPVARNSVAKLNASANTVIRPLCVRPAMSWPVKRCQGGNTRSGVPRSSPKKKQHPETCFWYAEALSVAADGLLRRSARGAEECSGRCLVTKAALDPWHIVTLICEALNRAWIVLVKVHMLLW